MQSLVDMQKWSSEQNWQYPDIDNDDAIAISSHQYSEEDPIDDDTLEVLADKHFFDSLTQEEKSLVTQRFGLEGKTATSLKEIAKSTNQNYNHVKNAFGNAINKLRSKLK